MNLRKLETVVMELNFVRNCAAVWDTDSHILCICLCTTKTKEEFPKLRNDVMSHLKILPAIYKPDKIIILEHFNLTTSGKICLASLRKMCRESKTENVNPKDLHVNNIFENLWNHHVKSKDAGFLGSGGTSIAALQISSAAAKVFNVEFPELIGMLLKDVTFDECVNYIKSTLISRECSKNVSLVDVSLEANSKKMLNTKDFFAKQSLSNNKNHQYKCRGKIYGDVSIQERSSRTPLENISNIEISATYNLQKCVDASPTVYRYSE